MNNNTDNNTEIDLGVKHAKNIHKAVSLLLKKRGEYLDQKASTNKDKYKEYKAPILGFEYKKFALNTGYIAIISDCHGDYFTIYGFFVQIGYLIPLEDKFLVAYIRSEDYKNKENKIEYDFLNEENLNNLKTKVKVIAILPGFYENKDFETKIKTLGDYIDRGPESLDCMLLLDYLTKKEKEHLGERYDQCNGERLLSVCAGNHELTVPNTDECCALRVTDHLIKDLINNMVSDGRMIFSDLEIINGTPVSFSHTSMSKLHIYKILGIIMTFYKIGYSNVITCKQLVKDKSGKKIISYEAKIKIEDSEVLKKVKQNFLSLKADKMYSALFNKLEKNLIPKYTDKNYHETNILYGLVRQVKNYNGKDFGRAYSSLKDNYKLEDVDYFKLRDFIVSVLPPDLYFDLYKTNPLVFSDQLEKGCETYFQSLDGDSSYWPLEERYVASAEKYFDVLQLVGHDASGLDIKIKRYLYDRLNPYIKNADGNKSKLVANNAKNVISADALTSVGYHNKKYVEFGESDELNKKYSDSLVFIITPDLKFLIDKYSVDRNVKLEILPDTINRKEGFISLGQNGLTQIKSQKTDLVKKFASFKRFLSAYSDIKVENKPEGKEDIDIEDSISINSKQENSVDYGYGSDLISVDEDIEENANLESSNKKEIIGNPEIHYENNNITDNNNKISSISKDSSNKNLNVHINKVSKEKKSIDLEEGVIQLKTPMTTDETFKYFKSKIGENPEIDTLTSEDIDKILQDFDGKTNRESLHFFIRSCNKDTLSEENFSKLMRYYDDTITEDLLYCVKIKLNFLIGWDAAQKLFGNIDKSGINLNTINGFWCKNKESIEINDGNFVNNIIRHLRADRYRVTIWGLNLFLKMFKVNGILDNKEVDILDKLGVSSDLGLSHTFQTRDFLRLCAAFKKGTLSKEIGEMAISTFKYSSKKDDKNLTYYKINENNIETIVETFKKDAQNYIRNELKKYKDEIDKRFEDSYHGHYERERMYSYERGRSRSRDRETISSERSDRCERKEKWYDRGRNNRRPRNNDHDKQSKGYRY